MTGGSKRHWRSGEGEEVNERWSSYKSYVAGHGRRSESITSCSRNQRSRNLLERSQNATHPFTWQFKVQVKDENRYTAVFTRCGKYDYLNSRGMAHIAPAMCAIDYLFGECSNHWFLRESTIATGGEVCDCRYVSKKAATSEEIRRSKENKRAEAIRGGRKEF